MPDLPDLSVRQLASSIKIQAIFLRPDLSINWEQFAVEVAEAIETTDQKQQKVKIDDKNGLIVEKTPGGQFTVTAYERLEEWKKSR